MKLPILILGANSAIAMACAKLWAEQGYPLILAARDEAKLAANAQDLKVRFQVSVDRFTFDAVDLGSHTHFFKQITAEHPQLAGVLLAFGSLGPSKMKGFEEGHEILMCNFVAAVSLLECCRNHFVQQQCGFISVISSVAGDRGRAAMSYYSSAKAGLSAYCSALRQSLHPQGVTVTTVKPGFVDTPMTEGREGMFLVAQPEFVAQKIITASAKGQAILYVPRFWHALMFIIKLIPEFIFKRLAF